MGRLSEARRCFQDAVENGADHVGVSQNLWTLEQIIQIVDEGQYAIKAAPDPNTGKMHLRFEGSKDASNGGKDLERFIFFGRVGNTGNIGGPGLSGGEGFKGKPPIHIHVVVV